MRTPDIKAEMKILWYFFLFFFRCFALLLAVVLAIADGFSPDSYTGPAPPTVANTVSQNDTPIGSTFESGSAADVVESSFKCSDLRNRDQRKLCSNTTGFRDVLIKADAYAREECKIQFLTHKWRCYGVSMFKANNISEKGE